MTTCLWFNLETRKKPSSWFLLGLLNNLKHIRKSKEAARDKTQDLHTMLKYILAEFKTINDNGGIKSTIQLNNTQHELTLFPVISYIIGDIEGMDPLCGRMKSHTMNMNGLCRDCDIYPTNGDNIHLHYKGLLCSYWSKSKMELLSKEQKKSYAFYDIKNAFHYLPMDD